MIILVLEYQQISEILQTFPKPFLVDIGGDGNRVAKGPVGNGSLICVSPDFDRPMYSHSSRVIALPGDFKQTGLPTGIANSIEVNMVYTWIVAEIPNINKDFLVPLIKEARRIGAPHASLEILDATGCIDIMAEYLEDESLSFTRSQVRDPSIREKSEYAYRLIFKDTLGLGPMDISLLTIQL